MSTAPTGFQTPKTNWQSADVVLPGDLNRIEGNINAIESGSRTVDQSQVPTGNVGTLRQLLDWFTNRIKAITGKTNWYDAPDTTLAAAKSHMDAAAPHSGHETPSGAQAKVDAAMTSHLNASDPHQQYALDTDLTSHTNATSAHGATSTATANRIILRDASGRAKVAAPAATDDIAQKAQVDAVQTNLNNHISAADPHSQYALDSDLSAHKTATTLDHPDGSVVSSKLANGAVIAGKIADGGVDTLARIAAGVRTTAGGTEASRLAVTNASGRVGAAVDADTLDGAHKVDITKLSAMAVVRTSGSVAIAASSGAYVNIRAAVAAHLFYQISVYIDAATAVLQFDDFGGGSVLQTGFVLWRNRAGYDQLSVRNREAASMTFYYKVYEFIE